VAFLFGLFLGILVDVRAASSLIANSIFPFGLFLGFFFFGVRPLFPWDTWNPLSSLPLLLTFPFALFEFRAFDIGVLGTRSGSRKTSMDGQVRFSELPCTVEGCSALGSFAAWSMSPEVWFVIILSFGAPGRHFDCESLSMEKQSRFQFFGSTSVLRLY
jgi:hypothetical protein